MASSPPTSSFSPVKMLSDNGLKSEWAYTAAFVSIIVSLISWITGRARAATDNAGSDRVGIFIGHWAPTFFGLGVALRLYEDSRK